jgi:hypothetical protein
MSAQPEEEGRRPGWRARAGEPAATSTRAYRGLGEAHRGQKQEAEQREGQLEKESTSCRSGALGLGTTGRRTGALAGGAATVAGRGSTNDGRFVEEEIREAIG